MTTPLSTYRLQLHAGFTFADAAVICPYLADLGVTHVYTSPILQAAVGSMHGYDTVDHERISEDLGGQAGYDIFLAALRANGLGHVLDIVPNHMSTETPANRWWSDVLEHGRASRFAGRFDIDWKSDDPSLHNRVLVAILGDHYGHELDEGRIRIACEAGSFCVQYGDHRLPLSPQSLLTSGLTEHSDRHGLISAINARPDALHAILELQHYRLTHWRYALDELNYRRFFDVTSLAAIRVEDPVVFDAVHRIPLAFVASGAVDGLRVDHPDGLLDPADYFDELSQRTGGAWIVAEKILSGDEHLPRWPVAGTTGYDFAALSAGLLINREAASQFAGIRRRLEGTSADPSFPEIARKAKHEMLERVLASEVGRLVSRIHDVCALHRAHQDHTRAEIRTVAEALLVELDVYRSYVRVGSQVGAVDRAIIQCAAERTVARHPASSSLVEFVAEMLLLDVPGPEAGEVATRFQQLSAPVMAKGVEDTATYRFVEMLALNDVGADLQTFGASVDTLHAHNARIQAEWPTTMTTLSTHDSKRSEDIRARLAALTWSPDVWEAALGALHARIREALPEEKSVGPRAEHFVLQTLAGAWPISKERMHTYVLKAEREAKVGTSWIEPNAEYELALERLVDAVFDDACSTAILDGLAADIDPVAHDLSIVQKALQLLSPGVPDTYQGAEVLTDSLVDPDNRRPVDFAARADLLASLDPGEAALSAYRPHPRKLRVTHSLLTLRRDNPGWFGASSTYARIGVDGPAAAQIVAFGRGDERVRTLLVARLGPLVPSMAETAVALPDGSWRNCWTGSVSCERASVDELLGNDPVAVLLRVDPAA